MFRIRAYISNENSQRQPWEIYLVEAATVQEAITRLTKKFSKETVHIESVESMDNVPYVLLRSDDESKARQDNVKFHPYSAI